MKLQRKKRKHDYISFLGKLLIASSVLLVILFRIFQLEEVRSWYYGYRHILLDIQYVITHFDDKLRVIIIILLLYFLKSVLPVPIFPVSFVCAATGLVFEMPYSVLIDVLGLCIMFSVKYFINRNGTGGLTKKLIKRYDIVWEILEHEGEGNPWLLVLFRAIPSFPINTVSGIYGNLKFNYFSYLFLSVTAFMPKAVSYTFIGQNVLEPMSSKFILPIAVWLFLSGAVMLSMNKLAEFINLKIKKVS